VGGGNREKNVSVNLVKSLELAREVGAKVYGIVGRDGGFTKQVADACVVIPTVHKDRITPHTEGLAAVVWHLLVSHPKLQAKPTARRGLENTRLDLELGTIVTYNVLEAMRVAGVKKLVFSSSGTVYGETTKSCSEEDLALPISLYGASKLAGEAMIRAFVECFGLQAWVLRFGNVVGPRGTHGAALDFLNKLK